MKVKIGDIIEIRTSKGLAYAIYTDRRTMYGALIRTFDRLYESRPEVIAEVLANPVGIVTFFPLQAAVNRRLVEVVGNVPVPDHLKAFPVFRIGGLPDPQTMKIKSWSLWDGENERHVDRLSPEQRRLPILGVWNDTILIDRIESGWRPEMDPR